MADIRVKEKSSFTWLWILLGLLAAALLVWALLNAGDDEEIVANTQDDTALAMQPDAGDEGVAAGGLMTAESVEAANQRSLERIRSNPDATPRMFFMFDSAELTSGATAVLDATMEARPNIRDNGITLVGFADRAGPRPYNQELSEQRADQVRQYLMTQGMTEDQIDVEAEGETPPLVETGNDVREPLNRRVRLEFADSE
ncbi:OmpA family protein [Erythrobacter sp. NFXS35]|uniref:OmpA family protein n=1 Tax=Erythrobacter sp. NFXS35 TaxID=2818436 RepID=UPI0032DFDF1C